MYSPILQRHVALARVPLDRLAPGSRVKLELAVSHRYEYFDAYVTRTPLFNPERRTA
jgi:glycine cleavage system aminomethyltransferase T